MVSCIDLVISAVLGVVFLWIMMYWIFFMCKIMWGFVANMQNFPGICCRLGLFSYLWGGLG